MIDDAAAIRGHRSAASLATGPLIWEPLISPVSVVMTAALSSNWSRVPSARRIGARERTLLHFVPKFERYEKRRRRYLAHAPPCLHVPVGHRVRIAETRPLSKTVAFCIVQDLGEAKRRVRGEEPEPVPRTPAPAAVPGAP